MLSPFSWMPHTHTHIHTRGGTGVFFVPLPPLTPLLSGPGLGFEGLVNLDLSGLWSHLANKHKYSAAGPRSVFPRSSVDTCVMLDIDNQTVNRVGSNNQLIMNCK